MSATIAFCATGKSGLGHLRRVTNVAAAMRERAPEHALELLTNAALGGLEGEEAGYYRAASTVGREQMARALVAAAADVVVVDTAVIPDLEQVAAPLCLILRETVAERLQRFRLGGTRPWDLIVVPNPPQHWLPAPGALPARRIEAVGWIYRSAARKRVERSAVPTILIASGGGGNDHTAARFRALLEDLVARVRATFAQPMEVVQVLGPRAPDAALVRGVDRAMRPGPALHALFPGFDLVVSTSGYNSVLELACTDVPTLLLSIARTYDDQEKRTREWGDRLGLAHETQDPGASVAWMCRVLAGRNRRPVVELGPSGAAAAADSIAGLVP